MLRSLVGSEMCIRDRVCFKTEAERKLGKDAEALEEAHSERCELWQRVLAEGSEARTSLLAVQSSSDLATRTALREAGGSVYESCSSLEELATTQGEMATEFVSVSCADVGEIKDGVTCFCVDVVRMDEEVEALPERVGVSCPSGVEDIRPEAEIEEKFEIQIQMENSDHDTAAIPAGEPVEDQEEADEMEIAVRNTPARKPDQKVKQIDQNVKTPAGKPGLKFPTKTKLSVPGSSKLPGCAVTRASKGKALTSA
eukprot:TRINITY_DN37935_c0_g1_i1.p1 TRINITY_DN37935_c0_g1~~TRINITY_DN37935_c0_g1_i1.p1  ORF type:complete len:275 (-),score=89.43 TRINITY_DN37935_c0_g1_i1:194-958(-)